MKVGDYVRTKDGDIGKIKENDEEIIKYCDGTLYGIGLDRNCLDREVLKSNPNITKLIQVGDYVNGFKVLEIVPVKDRDFAFYTYRDGTHNYLKIYDIEDIKSIVTSEQFSQMEYRIGE